MPHPSLHRAFALYLEPSSGPVSEGAASVSLAGVVAEWKKMVEKEPGNGLVN